MFDTYRDAIARRFSDLGLAIIEHALTPCDLSLMDEAFPQLPARKAGARADAFSPEARAFLSNHDGLRDLAGVLAQTAMRVTRIQAFDKSAAANWFVPWHQDRAADGHDRPASELARMVALRIHLDDCDEDCGPLEAIPGSHTLGRLEAAALAPIAASRTPLLCLARRGDILALRPLLVHRSQRARRPAARRVLHLEFAPKAHLTA